MLWNPQAISYMAEFILLVATAFFFIGLVRRELRQGTVSAVSALLCLLVLTYAPAVLLMMLRAGQPTSTTLHVQPWIVPLTSVSLLALVQFAYRFPRPVSRSGREARVALVVTLGFVLLELVVGIWRDLDRRAGVIWFRPSQMDGWLLLGFCWVALVFLRQMVAASARAGGGRRAIIWRMVRPTADPDLKAARAFLLFALLPMINVLAVLLRANGVIGIFVIEVVLCWITLAQTAGFVLIYLNYMPERSSFMIKLVGICLTTILAAVSGVSWLVDPAVTQAYHPADQIVAGRALRFVPDGGGGYRAGPIPFAPIPFAPVPADGAMVEVPRGAVALPFRFAFYGKVYDRVFVREDGMVAFDRPPFWSDVSYRYGPQPAIYPLAVELGGYAFDEKQPGTGMFVRRDADRLTVAWHRLHETGTPAQRYDFQLVLHRDGAIDFVYIELPRRLDFTLLEVNRTAWLAGITPGHLGHPIRLVNLFGGQQVVGAPGEALIDDLYQAFQTYLNRVYGPIAAFMLIGVGLLVLGLPAFFHVNLVEPLNRLLRAVDRFGEGDMTARAVTGFNDEIGYLAGAFNAMAGEQHALVHALEERVAERTAQATVLAADNARLEERNRLSSDLHDTVSQTLFSAAMLAEGLPGQWRKDAATGEAALDRIIRLNRHALIEMRQLLLDLTPKGLADRPLAELLCEMVEEFGASHGLAITTDAVGNPPLPSDVRIMIYRIAQECLNNIAKHARATTVSLTFDALPGQALLSISDDGCGFDPHLAGTGQLGLQIMRDRADRIGASIEVSSELGKGTTMTLVWFGDVDG